MSETKPLSAEALTRIEEVVAFGRVDAIRERDARIAELVGERDCILAGRAELTAERDELKRACEQMLPAETQRALEAERDALRAENAVLREALGWALGFARRPTPKQARSHGGVESWTARYNHYAAALASTSLAAKAQAVIEATVPDVYDTLDEAQKP